MLQSKYLENKNTHVFIIEKLRNFAFNLLVRQSERYFFLSSILSCLIWFQITYWGFTTQYQTGILFHFSVGNIIIVILSLFYFMALSQYFLLSDKAFFYYAYYLVFSIGYIHYTIFVKDNVYVLPMPPFDIPHSPSTLLFITYWLYALFAIHFLDLKCTQPDVEKKIRYCSYLFLMMIISARIAAIFYQAEYLIFVHFMLFICILISLYGIGYAFVKLKGTLPKIFFLGTSCYLMGSALGFLFTTQVIDNPFDNFLMKEWPFFTQTGILLEAILFTFGLTYRMRLTEIYKNKIEKELYDNKLKELEFQQHLLAQREHISHDLHDNLGSTLNSISVFSEIAKQQVHQSCPSATPILEKIGQTSRDLISNLNDIVWAVNPKNDQFDNIVLRMRLFAADLLMSKNINIDFDIDDKVSDMTLGIEKRKHFFLIFKEAVNNVYKYADCSELHIHIHNCNGNICMDITDNGKGFDIKNVTPGTGLHSMKERAKLLNGQLIIESSPGKGMQLYLSFPV